MNRKKLALLILLIMFALSLVYSVVRMPKQKVAPTSPQGRSGVVSPPGGGRPPMPSAKGGGSAAVQGRTADRMLPLDLDLPPFRGVRRNIFRPIFREEVKVAPLPPPPPAPPRRAEPVQQAQPSKTEARSTQTTPRQEAEKTLGKLRFLGFLKNDNRKIIFLAEGSEIFLVKKGDRIAGRYEVTRLTDEAITISVLTDGSDLVFPLVENRTLTIAKP